MTDELCHCGRPLHYMNLFTKLFVEEQIRTLGTHIPVTVGGDTYLVQRHYIALHGLKGAEVPNLGFEKIA